MTAITKNKKHLWKFSMSVFCFSALFTSPLVLAEDPPVSPNAPKPSITIPTPETIPAPVEVQKSLGQFQNENGTVKIDKMFLERYKESVVRVRVLDQTGEEIGRAMGVSVGQNPQYIATPLSLVLGNSLQWADKIEISHAQGNKYFADIALIDEQLDLVLLAPENYPAQIPFVRPLDERPQITVFTISFENNSNDTIKPDIHRSYIAAVNQDFGSLSISGKTLTNAQAGTGIINMQGELVGMMLPSGNGVLASALNARANKAKKSLPLPPSMLGVVMGRGVLVSPKIPEAFHSIGEALNAMKEGKAPKSDPNRYIPAKNRTLSPKEAERVILKIMPGTYKEPKTLLIPSDISVTGSGASDTVIVGTDPKTPVIALRGATNVAITNLRIVPAPLQKRDVATVELSQSKLIRMIGNLIEAKGGVAILLNQSVNSALFANVFPTGQTKAISCKGSAVLVEGNAFLGTWPQAISMDKGCSLNIAQNLFLQTKTAITVSSLAKNGSIVNNSFIKSVIGVRFSGSNKEISVKDNLFYENMIALYSASSIERNAIWKSKLYPKNSLEQFSKENKLIQAKPIFENPDIYDFRIKPGTPQLNISSSDSTDTLTYGSFQRKAQEIMGRFTPNLAKTMEAATGKKGLAEAWSNK